MHVYFLCKAGCLRETVAVFAVGGIVRAFLPVGPREKLKLGVTGEHERPRLFVPTPQTFLIVEMHAAEPEIDPVQGNEIVVARPHRVPHIRK
jgi:hypothetical protein